MLFNYNFCDVIPEDSVIAVGDIHGCYQQYYEFLDWVKGSGARVILLGDMIDRGPDDLAVLERTRDLLLDPESWGLESFVALRGNHEQMFLNAHEGCGWEDWVANGGDWINFERLRPHAEWIQELPYYVTVGDTLFSHAGCYPGENPEKFMKSHFLREQFLWIREPFLSRGPEFEKWNPDLKKVVFGHTPASSLPYRIPNGVCIDTMAFRSGTLTAYNATYDTFNQFDIE